MKELETVNVQELEKRFIELGGIPTHSAFQKKLNSALELAEAQSAYEVSQAQAQESKRPTWAKDAGQWAGKGLAYVATFFTFLFVLVGLVAGTIALVVAEFMAVYVGFSVMDADLAGLYAFSLVLFYIVVLFIQEMIIDKRGYTAQRRLSLRLIVEDAIYFLGLGGAWETRYKELPSAQQSIATTVKLSTWAIIIFGVLGRLEGKISLFDNLAWYEAMRRIVTQSSLEDFVGYVGMFITTWALLWSIKWVVLFIYEQFRRVTGGVMIQDFSNVSITILSPVQQMETEKAKLLQSEIYRLEARNRRSE